MEIRLSTHAKEQIANRKLDAAQVIQVASQPEQIVYSDDVPPVAQSRFTQDNQTYLLRIAYRDDGETRIVITVYKTSKVEKYWQG